MSADLGSDLAEWGVANFEYPIPADAERIEPKRWGVVNFDIGAGSQTNTLQAPEAPFIQLILKAHADGGGSRTITSTAVVNTTGNNTLIFADAGDVIKLESIPNAARTGYCWEATFNSGVALSTV